jgi:hypothetical protein
MKALKLCVVLGLVLAVSGTAGAVGVAMPYTWFTAENWGVGTVYGTTDANGVVDKPASEFTPWDGTGTPPEFWKILPPTNSYGDDSWGIFRMNSMALGRVKTDGYIEKEPDIDPYWQYGSGAAEEILGIFHGATDQTVTVHVDGSIIVKSSGFTLELYEIAKTDLPSGYMGTLLDLDPLERTAANEYDFLDGTLGTPLMKATTTDFTYSSRAGKSLVEGEATFYSNNDETYGGAWTAYIDDLDHYAFEFADSDIYISWDTDQYSNDPGQDGYSWMYHSHDEGSFGAVPEPITMLGVGAALGALGGYIRRRRRA